MAKRLEIFLVEDDENDRNALINAFNNYPEDLSVMGYTDDSESALLKITEQKPDAVVLDLELKRGKGDGLELLNNLRAANLAKRPYVLITTNNISSVTHEMARKLGCDYIMTKCQGDYSPQKVAAFLINVKNVLYSNTADKTTPPAKQSPPNENAEKLMRRQLHYEFNVLGVNHKSVGYGYLVEAVFFVINGFTQYLSHRVGKKFGKSEQSVERAMQNAIIRAWNNANPDELKQLYTARVHSDKGVPTVNEFVFYYAQKMQDYYL